MSNLYHTDVVVWSEQQASLLNRIATGERVNSDELDWPNIAEKIDSLAKTYRRELGSRVSTVLIHLMKPVASPADAPRGGWVETVWSQREEIDALLTDTPSLRQTVSGVIAERLGSARKRAAAPLAYYGESSLVDIDSLTFTEDQVLGDWLPEQPAVPS
ncbi:DUF29 domain-containing protein [Rhodopila sp.]|uniref:DUF29 domain-containing protein n=1 Tax=Rhodopila sp. TaxID=2480087 RepID=UPI003D1100A5